MFVTVLLLTLLIIKVDNLNAQKVQAFIADRYNVQMLDTETQKLKIVSSDTTICVIEVDSTNKEIRVVKDNTVIDFFTIIKTELYTPQYGNPPTTRYFCIGNDSRMCEVIVPKQLFMGKEVTLSIYIKKQVLFTNFLYEFLVNAKL